jgi:hypothetical protein
MRIAALSLVALLVAGCVSQKQVTTAVQKAHMAKMKADVALMLLSKPTREEFERTVKNLGGTLGVGMKADALAAYFPLRDIREESRSLVVTYRFDESGRVVALAVDELILTRCYW